MRHRRKPAGGLRPIAAGLGAIAPGLRPLARPIDELHVDGAGARMHGDRDLGAIRASLEAFGQQKPIVVSADGVAVAGSGVLLAARAAGWTHVAAVETPLMDEGLRAYAIADNRTAELSAWDEDRLAEQLRELAAAVAHEVFAASVEAGHFSFRRALRYTGRALAERQAKTARKAG